MLNIKSHAVQETGTLHLRDAEGNPLYEGGKKVTITLHSPGSKAYGRAKAAQNNRIVNRLKKKGRIEQTAEERLAEQAEFLAEVTASFDNFRYDENLSGQDEFKAAYSDPSIGFIVDQVAEFLGEWGNFTKASTTN